MKNQKAFTLIELLVVIAIIAILAAILFPVFAQAKLAAKKTVALSDTKQLGLGVIMYTNDYDDQAPISIYTTGTNSWVEPNGTLNPNRQQMPYAGGWDNSPPGGGTCGADNDGNNGCLKGWADPDATTNWASQTYPYVKSLGLYDSPITNASPGFAMASGAGNAGFVFDGSALNVSYDQASAPTDLITVYGRIQNDREADVQPAAFSYNFGWFTTTNVPITGVGSNGVDIDWAGGTFNSGDNYAFADGHSKFMKRVAVSFRNYGFFGQIGCVTSACLFSDSYTATSVHMTDPALAQDNWAAFGLVDITQM